MNYDSAEILKHPCNLNWLEHRTRTTATCRGGVARRGRSLLLLGTCNLAVPSHRLISQRLFSKRACRPRTMNFLKPNLTSHKVTKIINWSLLTKHFLLKWHFLTPKTAWEKVKKSEKKWNEWEKVKSVRKSYFFSLILLFLTHFAELQILTR